MLGFSGVPRSQSKQGARHPGPLQTHTLHHIQIALGVQLGDTGLVLPVKIAVLLEYSLHNVLCSITSVPSETCLFCSCTGACSEGLEALLVLIPGNFSPFQVGGGGKKRKNPENSLPSQSPSMQAGQALQGTSPSLSCSELRLGLGPVR